MAFFRAPPVRRLPKTNARQLSSLSQRAWEPSAGSAAARQAETAKLDGADGHAELV